MKYKNIPRNQNQYFHLSLSLYVVDTGGKLLDSFGAKASNLPPLLGGELSAD